VSDAKSWLSRGYSGPLTPEQAATGIKAAERNARSLLADAELMFENGRWARAAAISILAIEEFGKVGILMSILIADSAKDLKTKWRDYRSHTKKNILSACTNVQDFQELCAPGSKVPQMVDRCKQLGFYSDCLRSADDWLVPEDTIKFSLARASIEKARILIRTEEAAMRSAEELRLWIKHMKPVMGADESKHRQAVVACFEEAGRLGVLRGPLPSEEIVSFLLRVSS